MPRAQTNPRRRARAIHLLLLLAGAASAWPLQATAQQANGLRDGVEDSAAEVAQPRWRPVARQGNSNQNPQTLPVETAPLPRYRPASAGALPAEDDPLETANENPLASPSLSTGDDVPVPPERQPRTLAGPATVETAAERNRAATAEELDPEPTGTVRTKTVDSVTNEDLTLDRGAEREQAIEGLQRTPEENPFEAPGIRVGTFILRPSLEQGVTATSNADSSVGGGSAVLSETTLRLNAVSDWSEHSATLDAYGIFRKSLSGANISEGEGGVDATLNYDLSHEYRLKAALGYEAKPESASSPSIVSGTVRRPLRHTLDGSLGLEKDLGKLRFGLTGKVERNVYADAELTGGGTVSQKDRDSTLASVVLRTGYEISPALTPFVEVEVGRRLYDVKIDTSGYERSSLRTGARAGVALDMGEKLSGELSAGWIREDFDDDLLEAVSGATVNANLNWSPERGTTVGLTGSTTVEGTTTAGQSGSILYSGRLSLEREIRANLTGNAVFGADWRDYTGSSGQDLTLSAEGSLTWWLNRYAGLTGRLRHETLQSNLPGRDSKTNSVFLGIKVQR